MQSYSTAPGRNAAVSSGPPKKGLIEKEMMKEMPKGMKKKMAKPMKKMKKGMKK
jgi:hypothetical protein